MHRPKTLFAASLFLLMMVLNASAVWVRADDEEADAADEYEVTARVVRASLLEGEVNLRRAGNKTWERARLNLPLVEGDTLATASDARVEIQIDARNYVRVGANSLLRVVTLRNEGIVLSLVEGTMSVRLARFDRQREYFEIDMPKTTMALEEPGLYRLDVARDGALRLTAREGGRARIYAETDGFTLRDERTAELLYAGRDEGDWQFSAAAPFDTWDAWVNDRERYLAARLRYDERDRYYDADIWGAEELDAYGDWVYAGDYGWVWRPHTTATNDYGDWAPYRHGHWRWCPPYGWTWVGDEPWAWAPYHYGRWVYYNQGWCWAPRGYGFHYRRSWWRPALVVFVYVPSSYGRHVAWYPLTYGQHDPYRRNHRPRTGPGRLTPLRAGELNNLRRINPAMARAVTTVPAREFGREGARLQPAATDIARSAINTEPMRTRLPFVPREADQNSPAASDTRSRTLPARPASSIPAATAEERPTGAAAREPGVSLDDELWRTRLHNGRPSRPPRAPAAGAPVDPAERGTGAVARPALPTRARPPLDAGDTDVDRNYRNNLPSGARPSIPARPPARPPAPREEDRPPVSPTDENLSPPEPLEERPPTRAPRPAEPQPDEATQPAPAERTEIPDQPRARPERPAPVERDVPVERPTPPERREAPSPSAAPPPQEQVSGPEPSMPEPLRVEPRPEPARPEPPAPQREEPAAPPPPAEPAHREEPPSSPPPAPEPPPRDEPPAAAPPPAPAPEPQREAPSSPPPDRLPEEDRARPPLG